ncbi:hypothetical protein C0Z10_04165 [Acidipropionibacterium jensenii]|uniref:Uncharacterized protein n=1 Tax=Acidipropionibacterium jensenii TaxID=1749 RepID=A0A3Q9UK83_9ACTN|nr:hypothetical protein C0Z10_04165 [Acidipropionibacterium jensenii]
MPKAHRKTTGQQRQEDRQLRLRVVERDEPDLRKLTELLIRLTIQDIGRDRAVRSRSDGAREGRIG